MSSRKTFEIQAKITVKLTDNDIDDIMSTALDGGIAYWCCRAEVVGEYLGEYASDQIARGGALKLHEGESLTVHELTLEKFLNGFRLWLENGGDIYNAVSDGEVDPSDIDADCADAIVQYALFGEVVFG